MKKYSKLQNIFLNSAVLLSLNAVLLILVLVFALVVVRDFFPRARGTKGAEALFRELAVDAPRVKPLEEFAVILKNNPFGLPPENLVPLASRSVRREAVAPSQYRLVGTIASSDGASFAIFVNSQGKQLLFRVKSEIPGIGMLEKVLPEKVVIQGDTRMEIGLAEIKGYAGAVASVTSPARPAEEHSAGGEFIRRMGDGSYQLNEKMVQESINNPQRLMTDARLIPKYKDGKQEGFVLSEVKAGGIYDSLGLRNGDVLLRINEYNITNPEAALQAFTALRGVERLQLDILRDDVTVTMTYLIK